MINIEVEAPVVVHNLKVAFPALIRSALAPIPLPLPAPLPSGMPTLPPLPRGRPPEPPALGACRSQDAAGACRLQRRTLGLRRRHVDNMCCLIMYIGFHAIFSTRLRLDG
jgi:hypothetical protein